MFNETNQAFVPLVEICLHQETEVWLFHISFDSHYNIFSFNTLTHNFKLL